MKKVPIRKCVACHEHFEKKSLIRIVRTPQGEIQVDDSGKANGRGAYICKSQECLSNILSKKTLQRVFAAQISDEIVESLKSKLEQIR